MATNCIDFNAIIEYCRTLGLSMNEAAMRHIGPEPVAISLDEFKARQDRITSQLRPNDLLILCSAEEATHSNDVHYPYRTMSDMLYFTGWLEPEAVFTLRCVEGSWISTLFVQPKDTLKEIWEGRRPGIEGAVADWAIDEAHSVDDMHQILSSYVDESHRILMRTGVRSDVDDLIRLAIDRRDRARQHCIDIKAKHEI